MRYLALASDYDGTLAHHGQLDESTIAALERLRGSGRRVLLVTGRELDELLEVCPRIDLFDRVVAENGALLYRPETREEKVLGERPPDAFVESLRARGVERISVGRVIVATWEPHENTVLETIRDLGLELQVIFNKGAVMVLPSGVNKATGLSAALEELGLSPHNTVGVGDAENDHAFLALCECSVAVANALPTLKDRADIVTAADRGAGVTELIQGLLDDDLRESGPQNGRLSIPLGTSDQGKDERIEPYGVNVLIAGTSGSGKSTLTTALLEHLAEIGYQFVVIDPEGDYSHLEGAVVLGDPQRAPTLDEVLDLLGPPRQNLVANLLGIALEQRPAFFQSLIPRLQEMRARTGRPHWIVVDEAHHLLPASWVPANLTLPQEMGGMLFITVHPESVSPAILSAVKLILAVGDKPDRTIGAYCEALGLEGPRTPTSPLARCEVLAWRRNEAEAVRVRCAEPRGEHSRHSRKYAEGNLGPDRSFYFRGPEGHLNLRAQNLVLFLQIADGVDDETWTFHLQSGDYSHWFREAIKDDDLAAEAARIEEECRDHSSSETRERIRKAVESRYTLPSERPSGDVSPDDAAEGH